MLNIAIENKRKKRTANQDKKKIKLAFYSIYKHEKNLRIKSKKIPSNQRKNVYIFIIRFYYDKTKAFVYQSFKRFISNVYQYLKVLFYVLILTVKSLKLIINRTYFYILTN